MCISPVMLFRDDKCYRTCTLYSVKNFTIPGATVL